MAWSKKGASAIVTIHTIKMNTKPIRDAISPTDLIDISLRVSKCIKERKLGRETNAYSAGTVTGHYMGFLKPNIDKMAKYPEMKGRYLVRYNAPTRIFSRGYFLCISSLTFSRTEFNYVVLVGYQKVNLGKTSFWKNHR